MPASLNKNAKRVTHEQLHRIVRRLLVLAAIFVYIVVSFQASVRSLAVLQGAASPVMTYATMNASLILDYVGNARIRDSRLVQQTLRDDLTPRNDTLYLESLTETSFVGCSGVAKFDTSLYSNEFLRSRYEVLVSQGSYNLSFLTEYELVLPVVDCTFSPLVEGDKSHARVFYLLRLSASSSDEVVVLAVSMAIQNCAVPEQFEEGAGIVMTFTLISNMRLTATTTSVPHHFAVALRYPYDPLPTFEICTLLGKTSDGKWILESVPRHPEIGDQVKVVHTAMLRGLYLKASTIQSNIWAMHWTLEQDPAAILSLWTWRGRTLVRDAWAWVHYIHVFFAASTLFNQLVLFLIMYRNFQQGRIWIGDAFASVSNTLVLRGTIVLVSWHFNEYWTLTELCFVGGYDIAKLSPLFVYPEIDHADLLTLYLCAVDFLGFATKTRIDPAFTILAFEIAFNARVQIDRTVFPMVVRNWFIDYTVDVVTSGIAPISDVLASASPMRLWTAARIPKSNLLFILASSVAIFMLTLFTAVCFVVGKKWYERHHPPAAAHQPSKTGTGTSVSVNEHGLVPKRTLTLFEIATGAELQNRFGVLGDYDNFVYFKGLKFASADGIYCNGFVIANGKFLIATEDIVSIIAMKVLNLRLRNVYSYGVNGSKLKQTALIVYPDTMTWQDLLHLNVDILS